MRNAGYKIDSADRIQQICVLYISVWAISPPLAYGNVPRLFAGAATLLWLGIELSVRPQTLFSPSKPTFLAIIFIIYTIMVDLTLHQASDILRNFQLYIFLLFLIFYESYRKRDIRQLRLVFWVSIILLSIWSFITLREFASNPHVARLLIRSSEIAEFYMNRGVGGYGLVYSVILAVPILIQLLKPGGNHGVSKQQNVFLHLMGRGLIAAFLVISIFLTLKAGYSIALALMLVSIFILFVVKSNSFMNVFLIASLMLFFWAIGDTLANLIADLTTGTEYQKKLFDVRRSLEIEASVGTVSLRTERYLRSFGLFLENPLFGTLDFKDIGKHSAILDRFALYGVFIGSIFTYTVFYLPLRYMKQAKTNYGLAFAVAFITIAYAFLNNLTSSFGYMLFIFYPVAMSYINTQHIQQSKPVPSRRVRL